MEDNLKRVLESFLVKVEMPGVCGFFLTEDSENKVLEVVIIFDLDWIESVKSNPVHVAKGMKKRLKDKIENYLGLNIHISSMAKRNCSS